MSQTSTIARWIANLQWHDIPPEVIHQIKRCLKDFIGCAIGGIRSTPGKISTDLALEWGGPLESTILGIGQKVAARHAAFTNATLANILDFDDTLHGHHGSTTFPTALAAGEKWKRSGREFLIASIVGYELSVRSVILLQPIIPRFQSMWDLGTLQAFGACASAARLAGLLPDGIGNALGLISGTSIVPLPRKKRFPGEGRSMLKSGYGWASDASIVAAQMALAGFIGPGHALDDNMGFWKETRSESFGLNNLSDKLGTVWSIPRVEFKPYMACRFLHPVLEGVQELRDKYSIVHTNVEKINVRSFSLLGDEHHFILAPASGTDAQYSLPYTAAAILYAGKLSPEIYNDAALNNREILDLAEQINFEVDSKFDTLYPDGLGAHISISTCDGQDYEISIENPKGSPGQPLSDEALTAKFRSLVIPVLGQKKADDISSIIDYLEELDTLEKLSEALY